MTTHYQKIQALGNRMASNLETMGVSASFNDGGLTLADKILQIQHFNDGLVFYADKNIAQSSDTVNLYALLLKEGIAQSNKAVSFLGNNNPIGSRTLIEDEDNLVGDSYEFSSIPSLGEGEYVYLDVEHKVYLVKNGDGIRLKYVTSGGSDGAVEGVTKLSFKDGVIYGVAGGWSWNVDVSYLDMSVIYPTIANVSIKGSAVTDSNGIATLPYTCGGAGKINCSAKKGSIQSEPYNVLDATFYDKALDGSGNHNDNWGNPSTKVNINRSATGTTLTMDSGVTWGQLYAQSQSTYFDLPFAVELKSLDYADTPTIRFANESSTSATHILTGGNWKISFNSDSITVLKDGESQTHYLNTLIGSTKLKVYLELSADTDMLKYKDFAIYPI